jgi:putative transposase
VQITGLCRNVYRLYSYSKRHTARIPHPYVEKYGKCYGECVEQWDRYKKKGISEGVISEFLGISRATYYRYKKHLRNLEQGILPVSQKPKNLRKSSITQEVKDTVLKLRLENQTYGKAKIAVILKRDHNLSPSESTVGRVMKTLSNQGRITKSRSALRPKRKRRFNKHAQPWNYNMTPKQPGEMVQIDHMTVSKHGITVKHFQAWDPLTTSLFGDVFSNAKSKTAAKFLKNLIKTSPFPIHSIHVNGGSEFMAEFEDTAKEFNIQLFVLPPKKPQYNGGVERGNRILREEFYEDHRMQETSIQGVRRELKKFLYKYNTYRPHHKLKGITPHAYTEIILKAAA